MSFVYVARWWLLCEWRGGVDGWVGAGGGSLSTYLLTTRWYRGSFGIFRQVQALGTFSRMEMPQAGGGGRHKVRVQIRTSMHSLDLFFTFGEGEPTLSQNGHDLQNRVRNVLCCGICFATQNLTVGTIKIYSGAFSDLGSTKSPHAFKIKPWICYFFCQLDCMFFFWDGVPCAASSIDSVAIAYWLA